MPLSSHICRHIYQLGIYIRLRRLARNKYVAKCAICAVVASNACAAESHKSCCKRSVLVYMRAFTPSQLHPGQDIDPQEISADELCRSYSDAQPTSRTLDLAFVITNLRDTTLLDTALRSLLYFRTCAVHIHLVVDEATADIDWDWFSWYPNVQHSVYITSFDPKTALRSSTYENWGTGTTPEGEPYAWPREVMPSRFAKLSLDTIITGDIENLLFVDNDVVFLDDVCKAHDVFDSMSDKSLFGMATQMSDLYTHVQAPFAFPVEASKRWRGQPGVNSGVIFWKLKRAHDSCWSRSAEDCRNSTSGSITANEDRHYVNSAPRQHWLQHLEEAMDSFNLGLLDQDVFNYVAWRYPELLEVSQEHSILHACFSVKRQNSTHTECNSRSYTLCGYACAMQYNSSSR